jgi:chromosome segregation ATPase
MNEEIQNALIDLEASLNELDEAADIIRKSEKASGELIHSVSVTINKVKDQHDLFKKAMDEWSANLKKDSTIILDNYEETVLHHAKIVDELLSNYRQLAKRTEELVKYLNSVNFPARLDKIDSTIASINGGIQNLSTQIADVKRNIDKDLEHLADQNKTNLEAIKSVDHKIKVITRQNEESFVVLNGKIEEYNKNNKLINYIILAIVSLSFIISIINLIFKQANV